MLRKTALQFVGFVALVCASATAQEWADKMFTVKSHDFGEVARNAKAEFEFEVCNLYGEDIHLSSVQTSCSCTTPQILKATLKPDEKSVVRATFNTDRFTGQRGATLTVNIDRPYPAEVQLRVDGYIRSDVQFTPGSVQLGAVEQGVRAVRKATLQFGSRSGAQPIEVRSANPHLHGTLTETGRYYGQTTYDVTVELDKDAPAGYVNEKLLVVVNDAQGSQFPLSVEGRVVSSLSVSPGALFLGVVQPGEKATKQVVLRGKRPFRITSIRSDDASFEASSDLKTTKAMHLVPITFKAGKETGKLHCRIRIETELGSQELAASAVVSGGVAAK